MDAANDETTTERAALARRAIGLIDLTDLADDHADTGIVTLCDRARLHRTAAVCVWPEHVARCRDRLTGAGVRIATVVNFPSGDEPRQQVLQTVRSALTDGADDIDLVLPYRAVLAGDAATAGTMVAAVAELIEAPRVLKVILETGLLDGADTVVRASRLAVAHGADFLKTSTGKVAVGATIDAATAMLSVIAEDDAREHPVGLKPSGGIRTFEDARAYIELADATMGDGWATARTFRFGASGLLDVLLAELGGDPTLADGDPSAY